MNKVNLVIQWLGVTAMLYGFYKEEQITVLFFGIALVLHVLSLIEEEMDAK